MTKQVVAVHHARSAAQKKVLEEIQESGECPFCGENLGKRHKLPITIKTEHWRVTENQWPYKNTSKHIVIIANRHLTSISELTESEWADWAQVVLKACELYGIDSGAVCMRFGDPNVSGASVPHLHAQIIVPAPNAKGPVRFKIGP